MGINKAEQTLEDKLVNDIEQLKRDMREIKTKQPIGADVLEIQEVPGPGFVFLGGPTTVAPNGTTVFTTTLTVPSGNFSLVNFAHSLFIGTYLSAFRYPTGASLSGPDVAGTNHTGYLESLLMDVAGEGIYKYYIVVRNNSASSLDYYVEVRAFLPAAVGTVVA